ncbi:MAG: hypothetical protein DCC75_10730, partial [Proteobacteria bacterium]
NPFNDPVGEEGKTLREQCGWEKFDYYQQLNMLAAMRADLARGAATVYTIGLGDQDPNIGNIFQTYEMHDSTGQPISTFEHVKDALMARMANDQHKLMNPQELFGLDWELSDLDESPVNPLYPYDYKPSGPGNIPCVQSAANLTNARQGRYGFAQNSQELEDILTGIVAQRLRLVDPD